MSEQELVDCNTANSGCNGGWPSKAYDYVKLKQGLKTDSDYPYTAKGGVCNTASTTRVGNITSYTQYTGQAGMIPSKLQT